MTTENLTAAAKASVKKTNVRWLVVAILFMITSVNYADRATLSMAGSAIQKEQYPYGIYFLSLWLGLRYCTASGRLAAGPFRFLARICHLYCVMVLLRYAAGLGGLFHRSYGGFRTVLLPLPHGNL